MASGEDFSTLAEMFDASVRQFGPRPLFGTKRDGEWSWMTYVEFKTAVDACKNALYALGIRRGDRVCAISANSVEWAAAAYACYGLGAVYVPMYESQSEKEWAFIVKDSGAKLLLVANAEIGHRFMLYALDHREVLFGINGYQEMDLETFGGFSDAKLRQDRPPGPSQEDIACLIYTSGTTGDPKGVVLTHANIVSNIKGVRELGLISEEDRSLSFLPWAHAMGHTCELHGLVCMGASIAICEGVEKIVGNLAEVKPTVLFAVPRIFNKIYGGVRKQMEGKPAFVRWLFENGLVAAKKHGRGSSLGLTESVKYTLADRLVFSKVRAKFGGRLKLAVSGAAALSAEVAEFIDALGIAVYEGYGLSETSPIVSVNYPGNRKLGSVGKPISGVRVSLGAKAEGDPTQGELVVHGPNVMKGYYNRPEETAAALTADGGFRTGDLGRIDDDGFISITGRIKEQYKLENGKYVVPGPLEEQLKLSPLIANVMIHGDGRPYNVALVVPDAAALKERLDKGYDGTVTGAVMRLLMEEIDRLSTEFKGYEKIKKIALVTEDFTQENGMLTPTMKLKRRNVLARWGEEIERLYA